MKRSPFTSRLTSTSRDVRAGCFVCHGTDARWYGGQAQGTAARHHDATGHATWSDVILSVRYGREEADARQIDIEDSIAARTSSGGEPDAAPLTDPDAPVPASTRVSAPKAAQSRQRARGREAGAHL